MRNIATAAEVNDDGQREKVVPPPRIELGTY